MAQPPERIHWLQLLHHDLPIAPPETNARWPACWNRFPRDRIIILVVIGFILEFVPTTMMCFEYAGEHLHSPVWYRDRFVCVLMLVTVLNWGAYAYWRDDRFAFSWHLPAINYLVMLWISIVLACMWLQLFIRKFESEIPRVESDWFEWISVTEHIQTRVLWMRVAEMIISAAVGLRAFVLAKVVKLQLYHSPRVMENAEVTTFVLPCGRTVDL